jgi:phenylpropionate dioxygenase-like ring-hydroxylating dioxygenase large terminal subunit
MLRANLLPPVPIPLSTNILTVNRLYFSCILFPQNPVTVNILVCFIFDAPAQKSNFWFEKLPEYLQTGLRHSSNNQLSNQDLSMMHSQAVNESIAENKTWQKSYFMPSLADVGIVTFRKWLDEFAGGQPEWQGVKAVPFQELTDEQLYDRWHQHTKHCPSCRRSLILIDKIKDYCQKLTIVLTILSLLFIVINLPIKIVLIPVLLGILSLSGFYQLDSMRQRFLSSIPKTGLPVVKLY